MRIFMRVKRMIKGLTLANSASASAGFDKGMAAYEMDDYITALNEWRPLAEQGHAGAQFSLAAMYTEGQGVPQDHAQAVSWYRKAAEQGDALAQFSLAVMYAKGLGVPQDDAQAVSWYREAAEQGHVGAQFNLGLIYSKGQGVPQDNAQAMSWFHKSAEQGNHLAQFNQKLRSTLLSLLMEQRESGGGSSVNLANLALEDYKNSLIKKAWRNLDSVLPGLLQLGADERLVSVPLGDEPDKIEVGVLSNDPDFKSFVMRWSGRSIMVRGGYSGCDLMVCMLHMKSPNVGVFHIRSAPAFSFTATGGWKKRLKHFSSLSAARKSGYLEDIPEYSKGFVLTVRAGRTGLSTTVSGRKSTEAVIITFERIDSLLKKLINPESLAKNTSSSLNEVVEEYEEKESLKPKPSGIMLREQSVRPADKGLTLKQVLLYIIPCQYLDWTDWLSRCLKNNNSTKALLDFAEEARNFRNSQIEEVWYFAKQAGDRSTVFRTSNPSFAKLVKSGVDAISALPAPDDVYAAKTRASAKEYLEWAEMLGIGPMKNPDWL